MTVLEYQIYTRPIKYALFLELDEIFFEGRLRTAGFTFQYTHARSTSWLTIFETQVVNISLDSQVNENDVSDERARYTTNAIT